MTYRDICVAINKSLSAECAFSIYIKSNNSKGGLDIVAL